MLLCLHSQWTERLRSTLAAVGLTLAGRARARMASVFEVSVSRSTVLRLVAALPEPDSPAPQVVVVDENATRKGRHYGTLLVDVETRRPADLLPDREASSLAAWLAEPPGIEVACRDRAPYFAEGATIGAPKTVQVADRWASAEQPWRSRRAVRCRPPRPSTEQGARATRAGPGAEPTNLAPRADRPPVRPTGTRANQPPFTRCWPTATAAARSNSRLGTTYRTVKLLADAATPEDLFHGQGQGRPSVLDKFKPYLDDRWNHGCTNAWKVWEEIVPLGYTGSYQ